MIRREKERRCRRLLLRSSERREFEEKQIEQEEKEMEGEKEKVEMLQRRPAQSFYRDQHEREKEYSKRWTKRWREIQKLDANKTGNIIIIQAERIQTEEGGKEIIGRNMAGKTIYWVVRNTEKTVTTHWKVNQKDIPKEVGTMFIDKRKNVEHQ